MAGYDRLTKDGKKFFKELEELKKLQVKVGFIEDGKGYGKNHEDITAKDYERENNKGETEYTTVAQVAAWNELGTEYTPSRPFLRQSVDNNKDNISAMCKKQLELVSKGEATAEKALKAVGAMQVGLVQSTIRDGDFKPNAPITIKGGWIRRKGGKAFKIKGKKSERPLIDTGRMRQLVHYVIVKKGED